MSSSSPAMIAAMSMSPTSGPRPSNTPAFDKEVAVANAARAGYFIAIHNDGGAPSGVLGEYVPGDDRGARLTKYLVDRLSSRLGLPNRGAREVRLYSLEPERNHARYRSLLEIGDNVADRQFLSSSANRRRIGRALAAALVAFVKANGAREATGRTRSRPPFYEKTAAQAGCEPARAACVFSAWMARYLGSGAFLFTAK